MTNRLKLAAAIKIRNKELEFEKLAAPLGLLSKINPTSFRNTAGSYASGLGVTGLGLGAAHALSPTYANITNQIATQVPVSVAGASDKAVRSAIRSKVFQESMSNLAGNLFKVFRRPAAELKRQALIRDALAGGKLTTEELAENVTRYVPVNQHKNLYNTYRSQLGNNTMSKYRGAFIL
jgi:hypothetical protein